MSAEFITLTSVYFLALLSPGQDFFLILSHALQYGYKKAWWSCVGIAAGNAFYIALAHIGHTFLQDSILVPIIQYGGALFLLYLGILLVRAPKPSMLTALHVNDIKTSSLFIQGVFSALLNPKNILFYFSILFTIIPSFTPLHIKLGYGLWMVGLLLLWDMSIAFFFGNSKAKHFLPWLYPLQKGVGVALMLFGIYAFFSLFNR